MGYFIPFGCDGMGLEAAKKFLHRALPSPPPSGPSPGRARVPAAKVAMSILWPTAGYPGSPIYNT